MQADSCKLVICYGHFKIPKFRIFMQCWDARVNFSKGNELQIFWAFNTTNYRTT